MCTFFYKIELDFNPSIHYFFNKFFSLIICFIYTTIHSQYNVKYIDSIQNTSFKKLYSQGSFSEAISQELIVISNSKLLKYKRGEIKGYLNIAKALIVLNKSGSLKYLEKAGLELKNVEDDGLKAYMYHLYGTHFYFLGLHARAIKSFNKSLLFAQKIDDKTEKEKRIFAIYDWKRSSFEFLGIMDSVNSNERKCMRSPSPMLYIDIAQRHFKKHNIDSAAYYINKANLLLTTKKEITVESKVNVLRAFGQLHLEKKDYHKSIDYLLKSLAISNKARFRKRTLEAYKLIIQAYKETKDQEKENEFLVKYSHLHDSIREAERKVLDMSAEKFLIDDEIKEKDNLTLKYAIISIIIAGAILILVLYKFYNKKEKQKDLIISQKNVEALLLKQKLDSSYEEIINLAVKKDPSFMTRFKQLYSEFYNTLTTKYPELTLNDMRLCAFIKLNFSNKDIAEYSNVSVRTVESQKYRIRKKLGLSADIDFNKWVANHH